MSRPTTPRDLLIAAFASAAFASGYADAQLGSTIVSDHDASHAAVMQHTQNGQLSYHESTDTNGITVRQYVNSSGEVYAVSWHGPAIPDVQALLGAHYARYQNGALASQVSNGLHASRVSQDDLVVESGVRLRQFVGRAWLTSALPAGVATSDIE